MRERSYFLFLMSEAICGMLLFCTMLLLLHHVSSFAPCPPFYTPVSPVPCKSSPARCALRPPQAMRKEGGRLRRTVSRLPSPVPRPLVLRSCTVLMGAPKGYVLVCRADYLLHLLSLRRCYSGVAFACSHFLYTRIPRPVQEHHERSLSSGCLSPKMETAAHMGALHVSLSFYIGWGRAGRACPVGSFAKQITFVRCLLVFRAGILLFAAVFLWGKLCARTILMVLLGGVYWPIGQAYPLHLFFLRRCYSGVAFACSHFLYIRIPRPVQEHHERSLSSGCLSPKMETAAHMGALHVSLSLVSCSLSIPVKAA